MFVICAYLACLILFLLQISDFEINPLRAGLGVSILAFQFYMLMSGRSIRVLYTRFQPEKRRLWLYDAFVSPVIYVALCPIALHIEVEAVRSAMHILLAAVAILFCSPTHRSGEWFWRHRHREMEYYPDSGLLEDPADLWRETNRYRLMVLGAFGALIYVWMRTLPLVE